MFETLIAVLFLVIFGLGTMVRGYKVLLPRNWRKTQGEITNAELMKDAFIKHFVVDYTFSVRSHAVGKGTRYSGQGKISAFWLWTEASVQRRLVELGRNPEIDIWFAQEDPDISYNRAQNNYLRILFGLLWIALGLASIAASVVVFLD
jgi:hypothetical protein